MQNWQPGRHRSGCSALELFISLFSFPLRNHSFLSLFLPYFLHVIIHHICSLLKEIHRSLVAAGKQEEQYCTNSVLLYCCACKCLSLRLHELTHWIALFIHSVQCGVCRVEFLYTLYIHIYVLTISLFIVAPEFVFMQRICCYISQVTHTIAAAWLHIRSAHIDWIY